MLNSLRPLFLVRTLIESSVVAGGSLLGGTLGVGTIAYVLLIGPLVQHVMPWFDARRVSLPDD